MRACLQLCRSRGDPALLEGGSGYHAGWFIAGPARHLRQFGGGIWALKQCDDFASQGAALKLRLHHDLHVHHAHALPSVRPLMASLSKERIRDSKRDRKRAGIPLSGRSLLASLLKTRSLARSLALVLSLSLSAWLANEALQRPLKRNTHVGPPSRAWSA